MTNTYCDGQKMEKLRVELDVEQYVWKGRVKDMSANCFHVESVGRVLRDLTFLVKEVPENKKEFPSLNP